MGYFLDLIDKIMCFLKEADISVNFIKIYYHTMLWDCFLFESYFYYYKEKVNIF